MDMDKLKELFSDGKREEKVRQFLNDEVNILRSYKLSGNMQTTFLFYTH